MKNETKIQKSLAPFGRLKLPLLLEISQYFLLHYICISNSFQKKKKHQKPSTTGENHRWPNSHQYGQLQALHRIFCTNRSALRLARVAQLHTMLLTVTCWQHGPTELSPASQCFALRQGPPLPRPHGWSQRSTAASPRQTLTNYGSRKKHPLACTTLLMFVCLCSFLSSCHELEPTVRQERNAPTAGIIRELSHNPRHVRPANGMSSVTLSALAGQLAGQNQQIAALQSHEHSADFCHTQYTT